MRPKFPVALALALVVSSADAQPATDIVHPGFVAHSVSPDWNAFRERWGGRWMGTFDGTNGTPRFLGVPGIAQGEIRNLVADVARLSGVDPSQFSYDGERSYVRHGVERRVVRYTRTWRGVPVHGDEVVAIVTAGKVGAVKTRLTPITGLPAPLPDEMVLVLPAGGVALAQPVRGDGVINWVDRYGVVVHVEKTRYDATLTLTHEQRLPLDPNPLETHPARWVTVDDGVTTEVTDGSGFTSLTGPFDVRFTGPRLAVLEGGQPVEILGVDDDDILGGVDATFEAVDTAYHYHVVGDWLESVWPDSNWIANQWNEQVSAIVDLYDPNRAACNAFYDTFDDSFSFHVAYRDASRDCESYARAADVIYHEAGHRIHHRIRTAGQTAGNIGEGSSDYIAATITGEPILRSGPDPGDFIREIDTDRRYPFDYVGQVHQDGLIWASFLWNIRETWSADRPSTGVQETDLLFLEALSFGPTLWDAWVWVLTADDDDANWDNGTPHDCELLTWLDWHGIGPGPTALGLVNFEHERVGPQPSDAESYELEFRSPPVYTGCGYQPPSTLTLRWTDNPAVGLPEAGVEHDDWNDIEMALEDGKFTGVIPRVPANSLVRYVVEATEGSAQTISHNGTVESTWSFWVGDRRQVWCDDLEGDVSAWDHDTGVPWMDSVPQGAMDDWEFGPPTGAAGEPDTAPSGATIVATSLADVYHPGNAEHLLSPEIDLGQVGIMRLVSFQRWLSVEDAFYDQVGIWGPMFDDGDWALVWSNQPTPMRNRDIIDTAWSLREYDLGDLLDETGRHPGPFRLAFTLESDDEPSTNYSGWAMDDICVVELDDPEGHFRVSDLAAVVTEGATEDDPSTVELTWSMPWIRPVTAVAVMIRPNRAPTGRDDADGVQIATLLPAAAGETMTYTDTPAPGNWHYAVLLNGRGRTDWWEDVVSGANTVSVDIPGEIIYADTDAEADGGCGCAVPGTNPGRSAWLIPALIGLLWTARRRSWRAGGGMAVALALGLSLLASGCGDDGGGIGDAGPALPEAGPDLFPAQVVEETCGPWAAYREGRTWTWYSSTWGGITLSATVESFGDDGEIFETTETRTQWGESEGENEQICDEEGLKTVKTVRQGFQGLTTEEFDPPQLVVPRDMALGDEWTVDTNVTTTDNRGTQTQRRQVRFVVDGEQVISTPAGTWKALHIQGTDLADGSFWSRVWRVRDVGQVLSASFGGGFLLELVEVEDD